MKRTVVLGLALLLLSTPLWAEDDGPAPAVKEAPRTAASLKTLREHAEWLTSVERMGRLEWEHREACAAYIAKAFAAAGLKPLPGKTDMYDDHEVEKFVKARNVVAWLPGSKSGTTAKEPGSYIIVSGHFDHLGASRVTTENKETGAKNERTVVMHGADDNASGVAAMLEIARMLATDAKTKRLERGIVFVAFDLEEQRLIGSTKFVEKMPLPLEQCAAFVTMDQLGRSLADVVPGSLLLMGTENCKDLSAVLDAMPSPKGGRSIQIGIDFQPGYSDYVPFKNKKVPYVFVTSGACSDYHTIYDRVNRLQWPHLGARTEWCRDLFVALADAKKTFTWHDEPKYHPKEIHTLREVIGDVQKNIEGEQLPEMVPVMLKNYAGYLDKILEDGEVSAQERTNARTTALTLFRMAQQLR